MILKANGCWGHLRGTNNSSDPIGIWEVRYVLIGGLGKSTTSLGRWFYNQLFKEDRPLFLRLVVVQSCTRLLFSNRHFIDTTLKLNESTKLNNLKGSLGIGERIWPPEVNILARALFALLDDLLAFGTKYLHCQDQFFPSRTQS
jgi:hypothetical protein